MQHLLEQLAAGELSLADLAGTPREGIDALATLGRSAFEAGRFEQALAIFRGLEALEADHPGHSYVRAQCEIRAGKTDEALASLTRFLEHEGLAPEDAVRGLILRASLLLASDRDAAKIDVLTAHVLAERSPAAAAILAGGGR